MLKKLLALSLIILLGSLVSCTDTVSPKVAEEKVVNEDIKIGPFTYNVKGFKFIPTKERELFQNILSWRESAYFLVELTVTNTTDKILYLYKDFFNLFDKDDVDFAFPFQTPPSFTEKMKIEKDTWISILKLEPQKSFSGFFVTKVPSPYDPRYTGSGFYILNLKAGKYSKDQANIILESDIEKPRR